MVTRPVAGDTRLGERFMQLTTPRVWPEMLDPDAIREIRAMKERAEEITERKGVEVVHTLNGSALAVPRVWAAIEGGKPEKSGVGRFGASLAA